VTARFFVDETDLALGKALAERHDDVVYPGHDDLPEVPRGSLDDEWLPVNGVRSLVVITRDRRIRYRPVEKRLWLASSTDACRCTHPAELGGFVVGRDGFEPS
jgi:hypothetical protein